MARKTTKAALSAIELYNGQAKYIYESDLNDSVKIEVLKALNHCLSGLLMREKCYHGYNFVFQTERWKKAHDEKRWSDCWDMPEEYYRKYYTQGITGDAHKQLNLI